MQKRKLEELDKNGQTENVSALPKRVRFYHAKIDAGSLESGAKYNALKNVIIIMITTYDPFGLGRMVYTIANMCKEVPDMRYDDGAQTIFLYTKGTKGEPLEELKQLLEFMEHTESSYAKTPVLQRILKMVNIVKQDEEVSLTYMKVMEREEMLINQGIEQGRKEGLAQAVLELLQDSDTVPEWLKERIQQETSISALKSWNKTAAKSSSIEEFLIKTELKE